MMLLLGGGVVLAVVLVVVLHGGSSTSSNKGGEVLLEPAAADGSDPFTSSVAKPVPTIAAPSPSFSPVPTPSTGGGTVIRTESGATVGLYGGTLNVSQCDTAQMAAFLAQNPGKAAAWVQALNTDSALRWSGGSSVRTDQISDYLAQLTPVLLRGDTRVTNNGFLNGQPTPRQSVLQAGTAVLVDTYGVPRARCACGNPLAPPHTVSGNVTYTGSRWPGFSPTTIVEVVPASAPVNTFVLVNIDNGTTFNQPVGGRPVAPSTTPTPQPTTAPPRTTPPATTRPPTATPTPTRTPTPTPTAPRSSAAPSTQLTVPPGVNLGKGDVEVTLLWTGDSDLDLHVIDPAGQEIYYAAPSSSSGGQLDNDVIPGCGSASATHVEHVFWPTGGAPAGGYQASVVNQGSCPSGPAAYELRVAVNGRVVSDTTGTLQAADGAQSNPVRFTR